MQRRPLKQLACIAMCWIMMTVQAQAVTLLRDAGIEHGLSKLAAPILRAAQLNPNQIKILVVQDDQPNAFVTDPWHIFVTSGLIQRLETAAQIQSVLAHEAAHIANGHLSRRRTNARASQTAAGIGMALAAATGALTNNGQAATGLVLGLQSSAERRFLSHTRAEESAADLASVRILRRADVDPRATLDVLRIFEGQESLAAHRQDPYVRTHPFSRARIRALQALIDTGPVIPADKEATYWYTRLQAKLSAFQRSPNWSLRRAKADPYADVAALRRAVAHHRLADLASALREIDRALALRPTDGFLLDLKAEILLKNRQFSEAARVYGTAVTQTDGHALVLGGYGRALLATGDLTNALPVLVSARTKDVADARVLRDLAVAYARSKKPGMASVVTAERYMIQGRPNDARLHAKRAADQLPRGSEAWNRAMDVLHATKS